MVENPFQETLSRGTFEFPIELYRVNNIGNTSVQTPLHWHIENEFMLVLQGETDVVLNHTTLHVCRGDVLLIPGGVVHCSLAGQCIYECLVFDQDFFLRSEHFPSQIDIVRKKEWQVQPVHKSGSTVAKMVAQLFHAMEEKGAGYELAVQGLLFLVAGVIERYHLYLDEGDTLLRTSKNIEPLKSTLAFIRENYSRPVTLAELAACADMSPRYFCRYFASLTQKTPIEYLNNYRLELAAALLNGNDLSIAEISAQCGFHNTSYFIKLFRRCKGISPMQYRKTAEGGTPHDERAAMQQAASHAG